ncbi:MFS transporter [Saccharopolyspora cebuensis]|uniref:MFS transporter n=1 Tax=Saccharopolyspora cebuensis TaxID=418759 RepID=A0ABV4CSK1_9PSEU
MTRTVPSAPPRSTRGGRTAWLVWGVGAACYFAAMFHRASLGVAAPAALERFSAGPAVLAVFSALQMGVYLALQVPAGVLADRLGPRKVISGGMLALALGSAVFGISGSVLGGVAGRMLIGFGDAFMFTNVLRLAAHWFPPARYGQVAAITGLIGGLGQVLSTVPLAAALHGFGWVPTFVGAAGLTLALAAVAAGVIRERTDERPATAPPRERIGASLRAVVAQRGTRHAFWVHFVLMAQFVALTTLWGQPWLTEAQGRSRTEAGSLLLLAVVAFIVGSLVAGQFAAGRPLRRDRYALAMSVAVVVAWVVLAGWPGALPTPLLVVALAVIGVAGGAAMLAFDGARLANAEHRSGTASGVVNMGGFTAAVLIQLLVGGVLQATSSLPGPTAYRWAFLPVVLLLLLGTVAQGLSRVRAAPERG